MNSHRRCKAGLCRTTRLLSPHSPASAPLAGSPRHRRPAADPRRSWSLPPPLSPSSQPPPSNTPTSPRSSPDLYSSSPSVQAPPAPPRRRRTLARPTTATNSRPWNPKSMRLGFNLSRSISDRDNIKIFVWWNLKLIKITWNYRCGCGMNWSPRRRMCRAGRRGWCRRRQRRRRRRQRSLARGLLFLPPELLDRAEASRGGGS